MDKTVGFKLIVVALFLWMISTASAIFFPLILATVLTFILNPLVGFLCREYRALTRHSLPQSAAILLSFVILLVLLSTLFSFILFPFVREFNKFAANLPAMVGQLQAMAQNFQQQANAAQVPENIRNMGDQMLQNSASYAVGITRKLLNQTIDFASQVVELVVVPILTYYFLKDWRFLRDGLVSFFPKTSRPKVKEILEDMGWAISSYIQGQIWVSIMMGFFVFVGLYFLHVDYPLVLGLLTAITEAIPIIGPILGALPAILLAFVTSPALAVKVTLFYFLAQQMENHILVPKIMGRFIQIHPVFVIISILIGAQLSGLAGMILAVPVVALIKVLIRHLWTD